MIIYVNMLISAIFFICELVLGILIFDFFDPEKKFNIWEKALFGATIGFLFSNFALLVLALISKSLLLAIILYCGIFLIALGFKADQIFIFYAEMKAGLKGWDVKKNLWIFPFLLIGIPYCYYLWNLLFKDKNGNINAFLSGWGDNGFHISLIQRLSTASPFNLDNPLLAGAQITYHFLFDFSSAVLYFISSDLLFSYRIPLVTFGIVLFCSIFMLVLRLYKSKALAIASILMAFFGSGLGFVFALKDIKTAVLERGIMGIFSFFKNIPYEYTTIKFDADVEGKVALFKNINWLVPVVSFLSHQRAFLVGVACFILLLTAIIAYGNSKKFWRFAIIAGLLPLAHVHTFFAIFLTMAALFWFYLKNWKSWMKFALLTALLAIPQVVYLKASNAAGQNFFLKPYFGWMACSHNDSWFFCDKAAYADNIFFFWFKNFGFIFIAWLSILIMVAFLKAKKNSPLSRIDFDYKFIIASVVLFAVPNLFLFQPWNYDNNKVLFYWQLLAVIFCLMPMLKIFWKKSAAFKAFIAAFFILSVLSGILDFSTKLIEMKAKSYRYSDSRPENAEMANWIRKNTLPNSLFLTSSWVDPVPVFLAGRRIFLGYPGWLWTEGLDYYKNQLKGEKILSGDIRLACDEKIDYILLDKDLRGSYDKISLDEEYILRNSEVVYSQTARNETRKILKILCGN